MLCYKDKTFCTYYKLCKDGKTCKSALTNTVKKEANIFGLPICIFTSYPDCFKNIK